MQLIIPDNVRSIIEKLQENGYEAFAVGGCVRDSYLGKEPHDWDITTSALPEQVKALFRRTIDVGIQHGTVVVMLGDEGYEVTTYRIDGEYDDCRHPKEVTFTNNLQEDLRRRDFTINAMAYSDKTGIIDIFGGVEDLNAGIIRAVGDARERFTEDALRILRAIRFAATYGCEIEEKTKEAIRELAPNLSKISAERIRIEIEKTLLSNHPDYMRIAYTLGVTKIVLPEFDELMKCEQNTPHHCYTVGEHTLAALMAVKDLDSDLSERDRTSLRVATFLHDVAKPCMKTTDEKGVDHFKMHPEKGAEMAKDILRRLKYDNKTIDTVYALVKYHDLRPRLTFPKIRQAIIQVGLDNMDMLHILKLADCAAQSDYEKEEKLKLIYSFDNMYKEIRDNNDCLYIKDLAVSGKDLIEIGIKAGPEMGEVLGQLLDEVLRDQSKNDREILLAIAGNITGNSIV